jgi:hypothetical protein
MASAEASQLQHGFSRIEVARMSSQAVQHSWKAYENHAWGFDELMPLNKSGINSFGGLGATIIDSLDTLHMMGMKAEFKRCAALVYVTTLCK